MANTQSFVEASNLIPGPVQGLLFKAFPANPAVGVSSGDTMSEWPPSYAPKYPHNNVQASQSGHLLEFDDTPEAQRVHLHHRSGTHIEMRPDGSVKIKSVKNRQDVTIGDHEVMIQGDYKITVDGNAKIYVRRGSLEVQCDSGAAFNIKGQLKMTADDITLRGRSKIALQAPLIDLGDGLLPYMTLPASVAPLMGIAFPMMSGLALPGVSNIPIPKSPSGSSGGSVSIGQLATVFKAVSSVATALNTLSAYKNAAQLSLSLLKTAAAARGGDPIVPEIQQPDELPLANPLLYAPTTPAKVLLRDRQFDSPDDVNDTEAYLAHVNLMDSLKDLTSDNKVLAGQVYRSDTSDPAPEPEPPRVFYLEAGTVSCVSGSQTVRGSGTQFTEEVAAGQIVDINTRTFEVVAVLSDTELVLDVPWDRSDVTGARMGLRMFRPFAEFFNKTTFTATTPLGESGLTVGDLMANYIPPTIEKIPPILQIAKPNTLTIDETASGALSSATTVTDTSGGRDSQFLFPASEQDR